jgi:hypothetical protein
MEPTTNTTPPVNVLPEVGEPIPTTDPAREVIEAIAVDCRIMPREYLDEVRVVGGGE